MKNKLFGVALLVIVSVLSIMAGVSSNKAEANAPQGFPALVSTTTANFATSAGTTNTLFATSTNKSTCSSRIVSTRGSAIMLTFSDIRGDIPTALTGHVQAASTTVAYDASIYGCDRVRAYFFGAEGISLTETKW